MNRQNNLHVCSTRRVDGLTRRQCDTYKPTYQLKTSPSRSLTPAEQKSSTCICKRGRMNGGGGWHSRRTTPPPLAFHVSVRSVDSMVGVGLGIKSRSAIHWLHYLVPSPPPFAASNEIHLVCFRRWVWLGAVFAHRAAVQHGGGRSS